MIFCAHFLLINHECSLGMLYLYKVSQILSWQPLSPYNCHTHTHKTNFGHKDTLRIHHLGAKTSQFSWGCLPPNRRSTSCLRRSRSRGSTMFASPTPWSDPPFFQGCWHPRMQAHISFFMIMINCLPYKINLMIHASWAHLCILHGGLICIAFCPSVRPSVCLSLDDKYTYPPKCVYDIILSLYFMVGSHWNLA